MVNTAVSLATTDGQQEKKQEKLPNRERNTDGTVLWSSQLRDTEVSQMLFLFVLTENNWTWMWTRVALFLPSTNLLNILATKQSIIIIIFTSLST